jgi:hypothetical protein
MKLFDDFTKAKLVSAIALLTIAMAVSAEGIEQSIFSSVSDLPASPLRDKIGGLSSAAQKKALNSLAKMTLSKQDMAYVQVDSNGAVFFVDTYLPPALPESSKTSDSGQVAFISSNDAFSLHSKPKAKKIIYLDFNGMDISNTAWNQGSAATFFAQAYDTDGNPDFSPDELNKIVDIWHRVAEDYMPFNVDVTTQEPKVFGTNVGRILITHSVDKKGVKLPASGAGGVAYVGVWGDPNYQFYSPALVYFNNLGGGHPPYVAEASSHEMGHNLGLAHDGTSTAVYYRGLGAGYVSWAPIMGNGYYNQVTQWSKGEYPDANQKQDDIAIIKDKLGYRSDDHGNKLDTATPLVIGVDGAIAATNPETDPHNADTANKGFVGKSTDVDYFSFYAGEGAVNITVTPAWDAFYDKNNRGANLDVQALLYRWDGTLLQKSDPLDETKAVISKTVPAGQYFLAVKGVGNTVTPYSKYDSLGQYFIRGSVAP